MSINTQTTRFTVGQKVYFRTVAMGNVACRVAGIHDNNGVRDITLFVTARKHPTYKYGEYFTSSSNWVVGR